MPRPGFVEYQLPRLTGEEMQQRAREIFLEMDARRTVRSFRPDPVARDVIENVIRAASTAPSGAHRQPWTFVLVGERDIKRRIRIAAEQEEHENYIGGRIPRHWRDALEPLGTGWRKPFLEMAPWLVVVFEQRYGITDDGTHQHNYYVKESVGIACGLFISALHRLGLATVAHTPSPMMFLTKLLGRPGNERPFVLFPVGHPSEDCEVPALTRKTLDEVMVEAHLPD